MVAIPLFSRNDRRVIANAALSFAEVVGRWSMVVSRSWSARPRFARQINERLATNDQNKNGHAIPFSHARPG
jgi:hypothetical protein